MPAETATAVAPSERVRAILTARERLHELRVAQERHGCLSEPARQAWQAWEAACLVVEQWERVA